MAEKGILQDKDITRVEFTFSDGTTRVLEGEELDIWAGICYAYSVYLLPGGPDHVLAEMFKGLVRGFVPRDIVSKREGAPNTKGAGNTSQKR